MKGEAPPEWLSGLLRRIDSLTRVAQETDAHLGRLLGASAELRREVNELTRRVDETLTALHNEQIQRRDEDIAIRNALDDARHTMRKKNAGAGATAGAIVMVIEWIVGAVTSRL